MKIIRLHDIVVESSSNPHDDLPDDTEMLAQLIVDESIIQQTLPVKRDNARQSWELKFDCTTPAYSLYFSIAVVRVSASGGTRLLGSVEVSKEEIQVLVEQNQRLSINLVKVNCDGPSLRLSVGFSASSSMDNSLLYQSDVFENQISSLNSSMIEPRLNQVYECSQRNALDVDLLEMSVMYERLLLLANTNNKLRLLNLLGDIFLQRYQVTQESNDLNQAVCIYGDTIREGMGIGPMGADYLNDFGSSLFLRFEQSGDLSDLNKSVVMFEDAVRLTPDGHSNKHWRLNNLSKSLYFRFMQVGDLIDINKSVLISEEAVQCTPDGHPDKPWMLLNLGNSLLGCFAQLGDPSNLNRSVLMFEDAVQLIPDSHPDKPLRLNNLGIVLFGRFAQLGDLSDLHRSVLISEEAVQCTPDGHPDKALMLTSLGDSLLGLFEQLGDLSDLNRSVLMQENAVQLTPDSHPEMLSRLDSFNRSLSGRFKQLNNLSDLNQLVLIKENAIQCTPDGHPDKAMRLNNLGCSLSLRFELLGDLSDLHKSVVMFENAVQLTSEGDPEKASRLSNLGSSLMYCFEHLGNVGDLNKAVLMSEEAVQCTPDGHPDKALGLNSLGSVLLGRFKLHGDLSDLNRSVLMRENAVKLTPDRHCDRPLMLNNLGISLMERFQQLGDLSDLNKSVLMSEEAIQCTPDGDSNKASMLFTLGNSLLCCFMELGNFSDLNRSVLMFEDAVQLTPDSHFIKPSMLNCLGRSLFVHAQLGDGDLSDLNRSILMSEEAVQCTPDSHPNKPIMLSNLGSSLLDRFEKLGNLSDINKSITTFEDAVRLTPDGHFHRSSTLGHLGNSFLDRFKQLEDPHDIEKAISAFSIAAQSIAGHPFVRFKASLQWAECALQLHHHSVLEAYTLAMELLPDIAWLGLTISDRHHRLTEASAVVRNAAAAAIDVHQHRKAIEWLEQGRSIIWNQLLQLRTPVDYLRQVHPKIADQFVQLSRLLEGAGFHNNTDISCSNNYQSQTKIVPCVHDLAYKWKELVTKIRTLDGFDMFLLPKSLSQFSPATYPGPIIILNAGTTRSDALVLLPNVDDILHIPLPNLTFKLAEELYKSLKTILSISGYRAFHEADRAGRLAAMGSHDLEAEFKHLLSQLWLHIAKPVLDELGIENPSAKNPLPHIWWCPTGPLAFLPIHAAGLYGPTESPGSKLSDFVISSYTPTLAVLMNSAPPIVQQKFQLLAVAQPSALPGTKEELGQISKHAGNFAVSKLVEDEATVDQVAKGMEESTWVHFACHGVQNISNPTESALLLAGGSRLTLSKISQLSLPHAELAFLSACQTATGTEDLAEEAVHLAAGMLLVGYRGVIATMWSIRDHDAPQVADGVYAHLFRSGQPDATEAAHALHLAVKKFREDRKSTFISWVPFIHIGA